MRKARWPGAANPTLSPAALAVAEQSSRGGGVTGVGVTWLRRTLPSECFHDLSALRLGRSFGDQAITRTGDAGVALCHDSVRQLVDLSPPANCFAWPKFKQWPTARSEADGAVGDGMLGFGMVVTKSSTFSRRELVAR